MKKKKVMPGKGITNKKFGKKLRQVLYDKDMTKEVFAKKLDEPLPYILEVLKGKRSIQFETLVKMCIVLKVPILDFEDCIKEIENASK